MGWNWILAKTSWFINIEKKNEYGFLCNGWKEKINDYSWFHNWINYIPVPNSKLEECYGKTSFETMW